MQTIVDINNDEAAFNAAIDNLLSRMVNRSAMQICFANYPVYGNDGTIFSGTLYKSSQDYAVLHGTNYSGGSIQKAKGAGTWRPWEWVNPLMLLGEEYRTTERYLGKPVYVMAFDFGALPNSTIKIVDFGDSTTRVISAHGIMHGGYVIPGCTGSSDFPSQEMQIFTADGGKVGIATHVDRSGYTAVVIVKYWKTTD